MKFAEVFKSAESEGKEKHVPVIEIIRQHGSDKQDMVRVTVGKQTPHPNTIEHHIVWIQLFGVKTDGQVVDLGRAVFGPSFTNPIITFHTMVKGFKAFCALSYCNIHGVWQNCIEA